MWFCISLHILEGAFGYFVVTYQCIFATLSENLAKYFSEIIPPLISVLAVSYQRTFTKHIYLPLYLRRKWKEFQEATFRFLRLATMAVGNLMPLNALTISYIPLLSLGRCLHPLHPGSWHVDVNNIDTCWGSSNILAGGLPGGHTCSVCFSLWCSSKITRLTVTNADNDAYIYIYAVNTCKTSSVQLLGEIFIGRATKQCLHM